MEGNEVFVRVIESIAVVLELFGVAVIGITFLHAIIRGIKHFGQKKEDAYERLKSYIGKSLQLSLEFLVAADIIRTILIEPTLQGILSLGLLIVVRTFLSWSITVENEGCWPWQIAKNRKEKE